MNPETELSMCACMGPMYGEQHCYCVMKRMGLPLNEAARSKAQEELTAALSRVFGWKCSDCGYELNWTPLSSRCPKCLELRETEYAPSKQNKVCETCNGKGEVRTGSWGKLIKCPTCKNPAYVMDYVPDVK